MGHACSSRSLLLNSKKGGLLIIPINACICVPAICTIVE